MRLALIVAVLLFVACILLLAAIWAWQERIVWQPPPATAQGPTPAPLEYLAEDGQRLHAFLVGEPAHARGLVIAFHGNAEIADRGVPWAREVARRTGWAVLLAEYRGYGGLPGRPTYAGSRLDAIAAWKLATERLGANPARIALYGHSLGSAVAAELAQAHEPTALLLSAPFTSARDMANRVLAAPFQGVWRIIGRIAFDTRARVAALDCPVWVVQGDRDIVVPSSMGPEVHAAARVKGELLVLPGVGHNDIESSGGARYWGWLERALAH